MSSDVPSRTQNHLPDIVVIQKKTALERYAEEFKKESARSYFLRDGSTDDTLQRAHDKHCSTLDTLLTFLTRQGLSYTLHTLDDLTSPHSGLAFYRANTPSGLRSKLNLVVCAGGDGTLLRTSHFVGGNERIVGINSVPEHSVGHLCALQPEHIEPGLLRILSNQDDAVSIRRLSARTQTGEHLPYALNDIYFGHQHPASASRYTLTIEGVDHASEKQVSSGLWIATPTGSTAAINSYGLGVLKPSAEKFLLAVREPYMRPEHHLNLTRLVLDGNSQFIRLFSRMRHGIVCVDGPMTACVLGFGDTLDVGLTNEGNLRIFMPNGRGFSTGGHRQTDATCG